MWLEVNVIEEAYNFCTTATERLHYQIQLGCYFSTVYETVKSRYAYCDLVEDFIWNHAAPNDITNDEVHEFITSAVKFFRTRNRRPCIYVSEKPNSLDLGHHLQEAGFVLEDREVWMFFDNEYSSNFSPTNVNIKRVNSSATLAEFCTVLGQCFPKDYTQAIEREFRQFQVHKSVYHIVAEVNGVIEGVGSLYSANQTSVIHNMATLPDYRNRGVATNILRHLCHVSHELNDQTLLLQCEERMEAFYAKRGFRSGLRRYGYVLNSSPQDSEEVL